jgi:hypothetical protein
MSSRKKVVDPAKPLRQELRKGIASGKSVHKAKSK